MADFRAQMMDIEYADVHIDSLPEVTQAQIPLGPDHLPEKFLDLTLEECISIALQNSKILRVVSGTNLQSGSVSTAILSAGAGTLPSVYDPAVVATTGNTQASAVDGQGNRIASRGSIRANQVGGVEDALSEFDAQFSALYGYSTTDRPRNVDNFNQFNPQLFQAVDSNFQAALSKRMATGTVATSRFTTVYSRNNIPAPGVGRFVPSDYTAALELQLTQPLMRGRGTLINRIPVVLARMNEDIQLHEYEANVRNLVRAVEHAYWDLYCGYRALEAAQVGFESATDLWRVADARNRIAETPPEAEAQSRALYSQFKGQVHAALYGSPVPGNDRLGLYGREQVLREKMGWSPTDGQFIRPADDPTVAHIEFDWEEIRSESLVRNTELRRQKWAIKQRELELISARNQVLPQIDLSATYRWLGVGDHFASSDRNGINFPNPGSTALEGLTGGEFQEVSAQLTFTPQPIGMRRALGNVQSARIQLVKGQEELREKEMALTNLLTTSYRDIDSTYQSMIDYFEQMIANEDEINVYLDKIAADTGELNALLDNLLRAEERRSRAQLLYYQAICEYNKSIVNIHYLKGSLLDLNNISLEEGAWVDKAYWDAEERSKERAGGIYFDYGYTRPGVVGLGPVEQGGLTEGNVSRAGSTYQAPSEAEAEASEPEEIPSEGEGSDELQPLPERGPRAQMMPNQRVLPVNKGSSVKQAAAFEWGGLGLQDNRSNAPKRVPSESRQRITDQPQTANGRKVTVIGSGGQSTRIAQPQWRSRN